MKRGFLALALLAFGVFSFSSTGAFAQMTGKQKLSDKPLAAEAAWVQQVTKDLDTRFPTPADAVKAGYFRYTNEDSTGAISYANLQWNSATDPANPQPSQLWYDVNGHLLGADYSVPLKDSAAKPTLWGLNAGRWSEFKKDHVHWVLSGTTMAAYGHAVRGSDFTTAGGDLSNPQAATIVKLGKVKSADQIAKVFTFPAQWDVELWVTPNPLGAFAATDPLVHPSKDAAKGDM